MKRLLISVAAVTAGLALSVASATAGTAPSLTITPDDFFFCCGAATVVKQYEVTNTGGSGSGELSVDLSYAAEYPGRNLVITQDRCTGKSLGPNKTCLIEITWLHGADTLAYLTISSTKALQLSQEMYATVVP